MTSQLVKEKALALGAYRAGVVSVSEIVCEESFRTLCRENSCGNYGRFYSCPPACGEIQELIAQLREFQEAVVYQTVGFLEDSFDIEGMGETSEKHGRLIQDMSLYLRDTLPQGSYRHLGTGGCRLCESCAYPSGEPCRHPDLVTPSISCYGINVSKLAPVAGMKYINGPDTVTYFGLVLLR